MNDHQCTVHVSILVCLEMAYSDPSTRSTLQQMVGLTTSVLRKLRMIAALVGTWCWTYSEDHLQTFKTRAAESECKVLERC